MSMQVYTPPYLANQYGDLPKQGKAYCEHCHAIRRTIRWWYDERQFQAYRSIGNAVSVRCPGCKAVEERHFDGELVLRASWPTARWDDMDQWLRQLEAEEMRSNPLSRIGSIERTPGEMRLWTTTGSLARQLGRELRKVHHGTLHVETPAKAEMTRISWMP